MLAWRSPLEKTYRLLALDAAQATFHLENVGATPVRILEVQTTCGCTTPKIDRMLVVAGEAATMDVKAMPLQIGEKFVEIKLTTDSASTPSVVVKLHIIGSRQAPYMADAQGDLTYSGDGAVSEPRFIVVESLEKIGAKPTPPIVRNELSFVRTSAPVLKKEGPSTSPEVLQRRYIVEARLDPRGEPGHDYGQILVVDPWDPDHVQAIHVHRELAPPIVVSPKRGILTVADDRDVVNLDAKFVIHSRDPVSDLLVEVEDADSAPISLSELSANDDKKIFTFAVSLKPHVATDSVYHVRVGRASSTDRVRIPISVRGEGHR